MLCNKKKNVLKITKTNIKTLKFKRYYKFIYKINSITINKHFILKYKNMKQ